ncbi:MAG: PIN domain-containing protein [Casimicrobiaceae bacterium]|nr:PIN domain-containing protein [Casimicrobiaceae bacterium]MCX8098271.1 PIN domain-containing protein [Casimicrobiaceae bacterium]MDW8312966.1 PIN domain-containing protein [Burkholderiales bacterium]
MILADTSVWIEYFRRELEPLRHWLALGRVLVHPIVIGELALGNLHPRDETLAALHALPQAPTASHDEALEFIEQRSAYGRGVGYNDVLLLCSCLLAPGTQLYTLDRRLASLAAECGVVHNGKLN